MSSSPGLPRLRFSLLTLVLGVIFVGACFGLWWRWAPWVCQAEVAAGKYAIESILFSPHERFLAASDVQSSLICKLVPEGMQVITVLPSDISCGQYAGFSNDDSLFALNQKGERDKLNVWSTETAAVTASLEANGCVSSYGDWAPDNRHLVTAGYTEVAAIWDTHSGRRIALLQGHKQDVQRVRFSADGRRVVTTGGGDGTVRLWDAFTGKEQMCIEGHRWACDASFSPDGKQVVTVELNGDLRLCDAETGAIVKVLESPSTVRPERVTSVSFLPDGQQVCSSGNDGRVRIWDITTGKLCQERNAGFSPDGRRTARAINMRAYVLDVTGSDEYSIPRSALAELGERTPKAYCAVFSPRGQYIATGHEDGSVRLWVRRRPEWWWGIAWLPEFWIALLSGAVLLVIAGRNLRRRFATPDAAPSQQPAADSL